MLSKEDLVELLLKDIDKFNEAIKGGETKNGTQKVYGYSENQAGYCIRI